MTAPRPTTLLAHHAPAGFHYDWLIDPPPSAGTPNPPPPVQLPKLWTARVTRLWNEWPAPGVFHAHALPPHRRRYLNWSGTLSGGRGRVQVVGRSHLVITHWANDRIDATLHAPALRLRLTRPADAPTHWRVTVSPL